MDIPVKTSVRGEWAKKGEDIKDGDIVAINDAGVETESDYGKQFVFKVETRNGEKNLRFNQTTLNNLAGAYGRKSEAWVGKKAKAFIVKTMVSGKFQNVLFLAASGWDMDDEGNFSGPKTSDGAQPAPADDIPTINLPEDDKDAATLDSVPF